MSINKETGIIRSPEKDIDIPEKFVHEYLLEKLLRVDPDCLCETEYATGLSQTYGDVISTYRRVAQWLFKQGVGDGDRISFYSKSYLEFVPCIIATHRVGATFGYIRHEMIVDKEYRRKVGTPNFVFASEERVGELVSAEYENIVVLRSNGMKLPKGCIPFEELLKEPNEELEFKLTGKPSETVAFITFTGGTTGNPKPIQITHRSYVAVLAYEANGIPLVFGMQHDKPVQLCSFTTVHMSGVMWRTSCLIQSSHTILIEAASTAKVICEAIEKYKVNLMPIVPVAIIALSRFADLHKYDISSWDYALIVGGTLQEFMQTNLKGKLGLKDIFLRLVMSECAGAITIPSVFNGSVGKLCPNTEAKVIDINTGEPITSPDTLGELYVRAPQRTIGYYNLPEKTAAAIGPDGFLKTSDLVSFDKDFNFYYFDRVEEYLVSVTGEMVSSIELEGTISYANPSVLEVSVIQGSNGPRAIVIPTVWPDDEDAFKAAIIETTNKLITDRIKWLTGGVAIVRQVLRTILGKHLKREMKNL